MREFVLKLLIILSMTALMISCDTTESSFDETIPEVYSFTHEATPLTGGTIMPSANDYEVNTRFEIEAFPSDGYVFERWEGDLNGNKNPESILIDADKQVKAHFAVRDYPLKISISGQGTVTEVVESRSINDGNNLIDDSGSGSSNLKSDTDHFGTLNESANLKTDQPSDNVASDNSLVTSVKLTAEPESGWYFSQWEGDLTGDVNPEIIQVEEEKNVTAVFLQEETNGFTVDITIEGEGNVSKSPDRTFFNDGDKVTMTANNEPGWNFKEWRGDLSGKENSQTVTVKGDLSITAIFEVTSDPGMIITQQPTGSLAGSPISPAPEIKLTNGLGEPIEGVEIVVTLNENDFTSSSTANVNTDEEGIATFNNLLIEKHYLSYVLKFDANEPDVSDISSNPFGVFAARGDPSKSTGKVPDGMAGAVTKLIILVEDQYGNKVTNSANELSVNVRGANSASPQVQNGNSAGEYLASYRPELTGEDEISIQLADEPIEGSPFTSKVLVSGFDPSNSTATVENGVAGEETLITILVKDRFGNGVSDVADRLSLNVSGANDASASVTDGDLAGEYISGYVPEKSGRDQISIQLGDAHINGSPFESNIIPDVASPSTTTADVPDGKSGEETSVTIYVKDRFGNDISGEADKLTVRVSGANNRTPSVTETNELGRYVAKYNPTNSGRDLVLIQLRDEPIDGSPYESNVTASDASPSNSTATVPDGVAGEETEIVILVKDEFGNTLDNAVADLSLIVSGANDSSPQVIKGSLAGEYIAKYTPENVGTDQISIQLVGVPIDGSPFESIIKAAAGDPLSSEASVSDGVAGEELKIDILVKDQFGNHVNNAADQLSVKVSGSNNLSPAVTEENSPGEYSASYVPEISGTDQISVLLGGVPVDGSPFESFIEPANPNPAMSTATVPDGIAGEETIISIFVKDEFGNRINNKAEELSVNIEGVNSNIPTVNEGGSPGEYIARYTPEKTGMDQISVQLEGLPLGNSPFQSVIAAGEVSSSNSKISAEPAVLKVGETSVVRVDVRDKFSNPVIGLTGDNFDIELTGDASVGAVSETSDAGTYIYEVTTEKSGDVSFSVEIDDISLDDDLTITFEPGEPSRLIIITQPEDTKSGTPVAGPPSVQLSDEFGNPVFGIDVSVKEESGAEFFDSDLLKITNKLGVAIFDNIVINRLSGNFRLVFSVRNLDDKVSSQFNVSPNIALN